MDIGDRVEVKARFDERWTRGFEIAECLNENEGDKERFRIRRRSDGALLPSLFTRSELREERKRETWWL